jgi:hypothetical protein
MDPIGQNFKVRKIHGQQNDDVRRVTKRARNMWTQDTNEHGKEREREGEKGQI